MKEIRCILFDLGGVLVDWDGTTPLVELSQGRLSPELSRQFWLTSPSVRQFESGQCPPDDFARGALRELGLHLEPEAFLAAFVSWDRGLLPGAAELLTELKDRYPLACLSNNNVLHWNRPHLQALATHFDPCLLSFETGLMKPDAAAYSQAILRIGAPAEKIVYFDDNPECIAAARRSGLLAFEVRGIDAARRALELLGALPGNGGPCS